VKKNDLLNVKNRSVKVSQEEAQLAAHYDLRYLLGLINSKLGSYYLHHVLGMAIEINPETARRLPIYRIDFTNRAEKRRHDRIVALVEEMLRLHKDLAEAERNLEDNKRAALQKRIMQTEEEINQIVYELYGLTEEEIKIVEGR
jgi:hypothetical protein